MTSEPKLMFEEVEQAERRDSGMEVGDGVVVQGEVEVGG